MKRSRIKLPYKEYKRLCNEVHERDGWKCKSCGRRNNLHCHHIKFRSHGGDDASYNLVTVCNECHDAIHGRWLIVRPLNDERIDADKGVRFERVNEWKPKTLFKKRV